MNTRIIIENSKSYAKIGLVTFHDFNYGSALQCFATQKYLGLKGFDCEIIERKPPRVRILGYISTAWSLFSLCLLNPKSFRIILSIFTSERRGALRITDKSESLITGFNDSFLNVVNYSYSRLKREARKKHFYCFFLEAIRYGRQIVSICIIITFCALHPSTKGFPGLLVLEEV